MDDEMSHSIQYIDLNCQIQKKAKFVCECILPAKKVNIGGNCCHTDSTLKGYKVKENMPVSCNPMDPPCLPSTFIDSFIPLNINNNVHYS